jgi:hypothetical protein
MSSATPSPLTIPPEVEAEMTSAVRAFVESLLERIRKLEARVGLKPQNSSLPPARNIRTPARSRRNRNRRRSVAGSLVTRNTNRP